MIRMFNNILSGFISILKGLGVTGRNMFRKPETLQYPSQKPVMSDKFRGLADLHPEKCIACLQCVKICPTAALSLTAVMNAETKKRDLTSFTYNGELCCFCGLCQDVCPTAAIYLNKCYEVAYFDHNYLIAIDLLDIEKYSHLAGPCVMRKPQ